MVRSSAIWEELRVEPLFLHPERSQIRWLGHLVRMPPGLLPGEVIRARPISRKSPGQLRISWRDYVSRLAWEHLGILPEDLDEVAGEREVWAAAPASQPRMDGNPLYLSVLVYTCYTFPGFNIAIFSQNCTSCTLWSFT